MKYFLPSSVMLTPFVVRYYEEDSDTENMETDLQTQDLDSDSLPKQSSE